MSLPARQQRVITEIDSVLQASEPRLAAMYAMFARLNQREPITAEPLAGGRRRWRTPGEALSAVVLFPVISVLILLGVLAGGVRGSGSCDVGYAGGVSAAGRAESAAHAAAVARFLTRTISEQAVPPSPATSDTTAGVC